MENTYAIELLAWLALVLEEPLFEHFRLVVSGVPRNSQRFTVFKHLAQLIKRRPPGGEERDYVEIHP